MNNYNKRIGILYILGAAFGFALMGLLVRLAGELPTFEKVFSRNSVATVVAFIMLIRSGYNWENIGRKNWVLLLLRSSCGFIGVICNFYAIDHMNIADASILNKLSPFFAILLSFIILQEKPVIMDILTTVVAFIGAIFVVKPSANFAFVVAMIGVMGGLMAGIAYALVRKMTGGGVKGMFIVFFFSAFSMLLGSGFSAMVGQICITKAYTYAPAKEISVYDYTQVIYSALLGFIFVGQMPDVLSFIGYIIIISMAVLKWVYNNKVN